jgi:hypothetical protein
VDAHHRLIKGRSRASGLLSTSWVDYVPLVDRIRP